MSTDFYAGELCATHIGCRVKHPELDERLGWIVASVTHSEGFSTARVVCRPIGDRPDLKNEVNGRRALLLLPGDVITVSVR